MKMRRNGQNYEIVFFSSIRDKNIPFYWFVSYENDENVDQMQAYYNPYRPCD